MIKGFTLKYTIYNYYLNQYTLFAAMKLLDRIMMYDKFKLNMRGGKNWYQTNNKVIDIYIYIYI